MSRGMPSMTALLGLLAVAGYQNRDKIKEMLGGLTQSPSGVPRGGSQGSQGGPLGNLGGLLGGASVGSVLSGGLRDLIERFKQNGQGTAADSWVKTGPNQPLAPEQLIAATSIFFIVIMASNARLATAGSGPQTAFVSAVGEICHDSPHLSLHQPHSLSWPPLPTIAFQ